MSARRRRGFDWLVVDAPGALGGDRAERLIAEADAVVAPVLPSFFDADATRRFLREIEEIKRVRKGRVGVHLLANRVSQARSTARLDAFFSRIGQSPVARIGERAAYADLADQGLAVFDRSQKAYAPLKAQWEPIVTALA